MVPLSEIMWPIVLILIVLIYAVTLTIATLQGVREEYDENFRNAQVIEILVDN